MDENDPQTAPTGQRPVHYSEFVDQLALQQARQVSVRRPKRRSAAGLVCAIALVAVGAGLTVRAISSRSPSGTDRAASSEQPTSSTVMTVMTLALTPEQEYALGISSVPPTVHAQTAPKTVSVVPFDMTSMEEAWTRCNEEHTAVFVGLQAFVMNTGAHPDSPDAISPDWIVAHPGRVGLALGVRLQRRGHRSGPGRRGLLRPLSSSTPVPGRMIELSVR